MNLVSSMASSPYLNLITSSSISTQHKIPSRFFSLQQPLFLSHPSPDRPSRTFLAPLRAFPVTGTLFQDAGASVLVLSGGYAFVTVFDNLARLGTIPQGLNVVSFVEDQGYILSVKSLSRKLVHILSGLLFMASWPLFSTSSEARYFASIVPLTNCVRLLIHGLSLVNNEALIKSVTREGKPEELLRGPLYYVLILALCSVVFWRESPVGVISLSMMCGGDGIADIMGRKFGYVKLPYNRDKSWAGSISMFAFGFFISILMLYYFSGLGYFKLEWFSAVKKVALVSLVATAIESLPTTKVVDDNISVPVATMVMAYICFSL